MTTLNGLLEGLDEAQREEVIAYLKASGKQLLRDSIGHQGLYADLAESALNLADLRLKRGALESAQEEITLARSWLKAPATDRCTLHWSAMVHMFNTRAADYRTKGLNAEPISHPLLFYYPEDIPCPCDSGKEYRQCCVDKHFI